MRSSSGSLRKGITGDTLTPTGTPARARVSECAQPPPARRRGAPAARQRPIERGDGDVDRGQAPRRHRRDQVEVALDPADLVTSEKGGAHSASTSITLRVMRSRRSAGW
jgi:hypothetical protein